ncbi:N-acyl homoserine lactonase family protein [Paradesulfitobacterium aromaticivorans]
MPKTTVKRLYVLDGGALKVDQNRLAISTRRTDRWIIIPIPLYLIQTEDYNILFDCGCNPDVMSDPLRTWGSLAKVFIPQISEANHPVNRLSEIGLTPDEITHVILSHLHFDHAGGLRLFPSAKVIVQKAEYRYACHPDVYSGGYLREEFSHPGLKWELIDGDQILVPGITIVLTSGHSPGHQSVVIDLPSGQTIILAADAVPLLENIDRDVVAPGVWNPSLAYQSLRRLKVIAERNEGFLLPNHDITVWNNVIKGSKWYE